MEDYVTFEQAKKLKKLGFDWECNHIYKKDFFNKWIFFHCLQDAYRNHNQGGKSEPIFVSAPTLSQVQKWLFERHGYFLSIQYNSETENFQCVIYKQTSTQGYYCTDESYVKQTFKDSENLKSYEPTHCLAKGISKVLEILKGNKV